MIGIQVKSPSTKYVKELNENFLNLFDNMNLTQPVNFTTRKNATLDLLLTNRTEFLERCKRHFMSSHPNQTCPATDLHLEESRSTIIERRDLK